MYCSVQQSLEPGGHLIGDNESAAILGIHVRNRFRLSRIRDNRYQGFVLTLSHLPVSQSVEIGGFGHRDSTLQSIEVKATVEFKDLNSKRSYLTREMMCMLQSTRQFSMGDATMLALPWWQIADSPEVCVLTSSGWDDVLHPQPTALMTNPVMVELSVDALKEPDARGYQRFGCSMTRIRARLLRCSGTKNLEGLQLPLGRPGIPRPSSRGLLDAVGGLKFLPGMLDRRPLRYTPKQNTVLDGDRCKLAERMKGPLMELSPASVSGIPECHLGDLLKAICLDLQCRQRPKSATTAIGNQIAPSLVRRVIGARFLGVSYCEAQAICSKCFRPLCQRKHQTSKRDGHKSRQTKSKQKGWGDDQSKQTFWHHPLPPPGANGSNNKNPTSKGPRKTSPDAPSKPLTAKEASTLACPSGCSTSQCYGEIKWECSGTLDDGTGQAKLFAERDAAKMLLAMDPVTVAMIEEGVWKSSTGSVSFSKTVPPPSHLAKAVDGANFMFNAREKERKEYQKRQRASRKSSAATSERNEILQLLDPVDRSSYLMFQECRKPRQVCEMDILVRCKPLADTAVHLNHTEIDVISPGKHKGSCSTHSGTTYSLLPLKLNLVDCCLPSGRDSNDVVESTWAMVRSSL
eukprot:Sro503_g155760.2  (630) ;mRNA; f:17752-19641